MNSTAVRASANGLLKALEAWKSDSDRAQAFAVAAKAALWMSQRKTLADAFKGLDVQRQLIPPMLGVAASSNAEAHCSHWAFSLHTALGAVPARRARTSREKRLSTGTLSEFQAGTSAVRSGLSTIRAEAARKDKELAEALEDAQHVAEFAESVAGLWGYDKIVAVVKSLIQLLRRVQQRWPAYAKRLEEIVGRAKALLGLLSDFEVENRVRMMILAGTKPPPRLANRVKRLYFATRENGRDIADPLDDLSLVSHCKNIRQIGFAGCPVTSVAPLLSCKKLEFIDAEASEVASFRELSRKSLPLLDEVIWGGTPAFAAHAGPRIKRAAQGANSQRRIVKSPKKPAR